MILTVTLALIAIIAVGSGLLQQIPTSVLPQWFIEFFDLELDDDDLRG